METPLMVVMEWSPVMVVVVVVKQQQQLIVPGVVASFVSTPTTNHSETEWHSRIEWDQQFHHTLMDIEVAKYVPLNIVPIVPVLVLLDLGSIAAIAQCISTN